MEKRRVFRIPEGGFTVQKTLEFVQLNGSFNADIIIEKNNRTISASSILGAMSLLIPARTGTEFIVIVKGQEAGEALEQITNFIEGQNNPSSALSLWDQEGVDNVNNALKDSQSRWTSVVQNVAKSYLTVKKS
ncbi:MAG: HPr family phosphocarrier protein [Bacillota bacterium]